MGGSLYSLHRVLLESLSNNVRQNPPRLLTSLDVLERLMMVLLHWCYYDYLAATRCVSWAKWVLQ